MYLVRRKAVPGGFWKRGGTVSPAQGGSGRLVVPHGCLCLLVARQLFGSCLALSIAVWLNTHPSSFHPAGIRNADIAAANYLGAKRPRKIWEDIKSRLAQTTESAWAFAPCKGRKIIRFNWFRPPGLPGGPLSVQKSFLCIKPCEQRA